MNTRSLIILKNTTGQYQTAYCHWDGYLSHSGRILLQNYNTYPKVETLVSKNYISSLSDNINNVPVHSTIIPVFTDKSQLIKYSQDYNYLYEDGKWFYSYDCITWTELTKSEITKEEKESLS